MRTTHGKGLHRSTPEKVAHRMGAATHPAIALALMAGVRGSADLSAFLPERLDQGGSETCFSHSFVAGLFTALGSAGTPLPFVPSPLLLASTTYADVRAEETAPGLPLPPLQDQGAQLADAANAAARWGVCEMGPTFGGRYSDVPDATPDGAFPEPAVDELVLAGTRLVGGEYSVAIDSSAPRTIAACLDAGIPVWVGGLVGDAYQNLTADQVAQPTPASDKSAGGHAQLIAGYRTNAAGSLEFLVVNSWGRTWALSGTCWASSAWVEALWDAWPMTAKVTS